MQGSVDVLVIGGGGAACRAAVAAADAGAKVAMVLKGKLGRSGATAYKVAEMAGFNVADAQADPLDSPEEHYRDIMQAAYSMADPKLARVVAEEAPQALQKLVEWGVPFERDGDHYLEFTSCFSNRPRTHVIKGHGEPIIEALVREIRKRAIAVYEDCQVTNLFIKDGRCVGAGILDEDGVFHALAAGAVVLATGGAGQLFARNLNPLDICGDGYTLGYEAGAQLINMEFMQAGLGISYPIVNLLNAWIWSARPVLTNRLGEPVLERYLPPDITPETVMDAHARHFPFSSADPSRYIEIAVQSEIAAGRGTDEGGVYLDLTRITDAYLNSLPPEDAFRKMWPITQDFLSARGVDVAKQKIQIACFGHAINGGLRIDASGATTVPGLFAAGEVAGGPHGADRLGGNMMVTCQVFGARAGRAAAAEGRNRERREIPATLVAEEEARLKARAGRAVDVAALKARLQQAAQTHLLVRRSEAGLREFLNTICLLREEIKAAPAAAPSRRVWDLQSLLTVGELMATAARVRRESRGSHFRADYPERDDENFGRPFAISRGSAGPDLVPYEFEAKR
ncbi:FAD-binding protein [Gelria sp. Kuro-4]|uniref:FAD-binding protein n=1 Tax=Gelria sp. Kuro-4 TaxID=2796927 RepID=UPI001C7F1588|nr:FAD-binding protein [Gelria sp. Kuro-4]